MIIPAEGSKHCKIAIVGEAPGAQEELEGKPFCGSSGNILNTKLHQVGLARTDCYITNLVKVRPSRYGIESTVSELESVIGKFLIPHPIEKVKAPKDGNDFNIFWQAEHSPTKTLLWWRDRLLEELDEVKTNIIIALGANALWALTGQNSIGKWRGSLLTVTLPSGRIVKVVGTYHPAAILRQWEFGAVASCDFKKALNESTFPELVLPIRELLIEPTLEDVIFLCNQPFLESRSCDVAYDIETTPGQITCVSLAFNKNVSMSIPTTLQYWGTHQRLKEVIMLIKGVLTNNTGLKIAHNSSYDIQYLIRCFNILPSKPWFDTMIAQHSCYSEMLKSLAFCTSIYTNEPYYKDDLKVWNMDKTNNEKLWTYNAKDSAVTFEIMEVLNKEIDTLGTRHTFNFMIDLLEPLLYMMLRGVKVDEVRRLEHQHKLIPELEERVKRIQFQYGNVNPNSPKQVNELIARLGIPPIINRKTGKPTTSKKALEKLSAKSAELKEIVQARADKTLISNFVEIDVDPNDFRLRCSFNSTGTETGRLSSNTSIFGSGRNLQNFPKKVRDIIIPDSGMIFTEADLKGAEARIVAYLCEDAMLIKLMEEGKNVHTYTANLIWGVTEEQVKQDKVEKEAQGKSTESFYYKAKRIRHSGNYRGTWVTVSEQLGISAKDAKAFLQKYYNQSPNLTRWHKSVEDKIKSSRTLTTVLSRKRIFFGRFGEQLFKEAIAYEPQETVAHILNLGLIKFYNEICKKYPVEVLLNVHDSILVQHPPDLKEFVHAELHRCMRVDLTIKGRTFFIPIDIKSGINWKELK